MSEPRIVTREELLRLCAEVSILEKIQRNTMRCVIQDSGPSKTIPGGRSIIASYYEAGYVCTVHRLVARDGQEMHFHVKDAVIHDIRYREENY